MKPGKLINNKIAKPTGLCAVGWHLKRKTYTDKRGETWAITRNTAHKYTPLKAIAIAQGLAAAGYRVWIGEVRMEIFSEIWSGKDLENLMGIPNGTQYRGKSRF